MDRLRGVVDPVQQALVADEPVDLPGQAEEEVAVESQVAVLADVELVDERIVVAQPDGQDVAHHVFQRRLQPQRLLPIDGERSAAGAWRCPPAWRWGN